MVFCSGKASAAKPDTKKSSVPAPATTSKAPGSAAKAARKMPDQLAAKTEPAAKPVTARKVQYFGMHLGCVPHSCALRRLPI